MNELLTLINAEDKELLEKERLNLLELHKKLIAFNLHKKLEEYIQNNLGMFKYELTLRKDIIEDFIKFIEEN